VDALDPDYADELTEALRAEEDHRAEERRRLARRGQRLTEEDAPLYDDERPADVD
jgi:hypothetical protein